MATQAQLRGKVLSSSEAQRRSITQQQRQEISEQKRKQEEQIKTVQDKVNKTLEQINQGKITEYEQIPTDIRNLINIDKNYFQQQKAIQESNKQVVRDSQFNLAVRVYLGQTKAGTDFKNIPQDIKKQAQEFAESKERGYTKGVESQVIRQAEQITQQTLSPEERKSILKSVKVEGSQISFTPISGGMSYATAGDITQMTIAPREDIYQMSLPPQSFETITQSPYIKRTTLEKARDTGLTAIQKTGQFLGVVGEKVGKIPTPRKTTILPFSLVSQAVGSPKTLGEFAQTSKERTKKLGEMSSEGYSILFSTLGVPSEVTIPEKKSKIFRPSGGNLFIDVVTPETKQTTSAGYFVKFMKEAPSVVEYTTSFPLAIGRDVLAAGQERKSFTALSPEVKRQKEIEVGAIGLFALGGIGFKGGKALFGKEIIREGAITGSKTPQILLGESDIVGVRTLKGTSKGLQWYQKYKADVTVEPYIERTTTKFRQFAGLPEKVRIVSPAKTYRVETPFGQLGEQPFVLKQSKLGKRGFGEPKYTFAVPERSIGELTAEEVSKLQGKIPEWLLGKIAQKKTGTSLPESIPSSKFFTDKDVFSVGGKGIIDLSKPAGKRTITFIDLTREKLIKESPSGAKVFELDVVSKQVLGDSSRRAGKVQVFSGKILELPYKPIESDTGIKVITSSSSRKTPLSQTFQLQEKPKVIIPIPKPKVKVKVVTKEESIPFITTTSKTETSLYAGTGLYEKTEEVGAVGVIGVTKPSLSEIGSTELKTVQTFQPITSAIKPTQINLGRTKSISRSLSSPKEKSEVKLAQPLKLETPQKTALLQRQVLRQVLRTTQTQRQRAKIPKPEPIPKIPKVPKKSLSFSSERKGQEVFTAFGKRFGKAVKLGKGTKKETEAVLGKFLKGTLGASGYLETQGKKVKVEELDLLGETGFRKSKVSPFLIVEKRERRLKRGTGEIPEIQMFKKKKINRILGG